MASCKHQTPWTQPCPPCVRHSTDLHVMNTITRKMERFITKDGTRSLKWYICGPTVYAPSHLGHARTYLAFDIVRRILSDYLMYDVTLVMNVTDIDDKIIIRSLEQNITCTELSRHFEAEFLEDMESLGVSPPDILTRVSEFIPQIVEFIQRIVDQGVAYPSNGSVYFDVDKFSSMPGKYYCKLSPENMNNAEALAEGEGGLTASKQEFVSDKRSPRDFALWKKSKQNEPTWDSPWGPGRPGWHIECSAMACDVFKNVFNDESMDIHSGGKDLKFPHHDNELAQSEAACASCNQWVNYFLHSGHLNIDGLKMSKSLKNFITIREALEQYSARQLRFCFLMYKYNAEMYYSENTMSHVVVIEKQFSEFFHNCKALLRQYPIGSPQIWDKQAYGLQSAFQDCKSKVHSALLNDFDTPTALATMLEIVKAVNIYSKNNSNIVCLVVRNCALYITKMFKVFGLIPDFCVIGFPSSTNEKKQEEIVAPILDALISFRSKIRDSARNSSTNLKKEILQQCDVFRDDSLPPLGVRLEDKPDGTSLWKLADPEELQKEKELKLLEEQRKKEEKELKNQLAKAKILSPNEYMKQLTSEDTQQPKYSKFDETGFPTHMSDGEPLNKSQIKKAKKLWASQLKKYEKHCQ